ncbi:MAG: AroM family protein [Sedimentibacter sp.]|uniref:AroM family protein n=1 Tax=Sedimentibacter sp. TaxID=1960295 RepID=UPI00315848F6
MEKIQITLTVEESKELIALAVVEHRDLKQALDCGKVLLKGGTTVSRISEKITGIPLRISGRVTERGTVAAMKDAKHPHSIMIENKNFENVDSRFRENICSMGGGDVIVISANAIDAFGNAAVMAGSPGGGDIGNALGGFYSEGAKVIIPAGIEKMVPGNLTETIKETGRKNKSFSYGMSVGLFPIAGEVITEIEALKILCSGVEVYAMGSGGLKGANGAVTLEIQGSRESLDEAVKIFKQIKSTAINVSGFPDSLRECSFPSERCASHIGCCYKSRDMSDNKKTKIGFVTIGQSPRTDVTRDIFPLLSKNFEITEAGALDAFTYEEICRDFAPKEDDDVLVTKMRDGSQVVIAEKYILGLLQNAITNLENEKNDIIVMLCTGKFPEFEHKNILLTPQKMLQDIAKSFAKGKKIGLIIPDESQKPQIRHWWGDVDLEIVAASPYRDFENINYAAEHLKSMNVDVVFMDCMGYTAAMKDTVKRITGKKVFLPRTLVARVLNELE